MLPVLAKTTAVVIDASMLLLSDREVVQLLHYDNATWVTKAHDRADKSFSMQHKSCQTLLEALAMNMYLSSPIAEEMNGKWNEANIDHIDCEPLSALLGFVKPLIALGYLLQGVKRGSYASWDGRELVSHVVSVCLPLLVCFF